MQNIYRGIAASKHLAYYDLLLSIFDLYLFYIVSSLIFYYLNFNQKTEIITILTTQRTNESD